VAGNFWEQLRFTDNISKGDVASLSQEQKTLLDAMLQTLSRTLALSDLRAQHYALHGLGHLHHPDVRNIVQRYLAKHRHDLPLDAVHWIETCRERARLRNAISA
jgi:hypothetical protein